MEIDDLLKHYAGVALQALIARLPGWPQDEAEAKVLAENVPRTALKMGAFMVQLHQAAVKALEGK